MSYRYREIRVPNAPDASRVPLSETLCQPEKRCNLFVINKSMLDSPLVRLKCAFLESKYARNVKVKRK